MVPGALSVTTAGEHEMSRWCVLNLDLALVKSIGV